MRAKLFHALCKALEGVLLFLVNCDSDNFLNLPSVGRLHVRGAHRTVYIST